MSQKFTGKVEIQNSAGLTTTSIDGDNADIAVGGNEFDGLIRILDRDDHCRILIKTDTPIKNFKKVWLYFNDTIYIDGTEGNIRVGGGGRYGGITLEDPSGDVILSMYATGDIHAGGNGFKGRLYIRNESGNEIVSINGGGYIEIRGKIGNTLRDIFYFDASTARLHIGCKDFGGNLNVMHASGRSVFSFNSNDATLHVGTGSHGPPGKDGVIVIHDVNGFERIRLDGNTGDIRLQGADCAEEFVVTDAEKIDPGTVLVFNEKGILEPCRESYDKKVAGVVSGGNRLHPGIILNKNSMPGTSLPIALIGQVHCKVDAQFGSIDIGDLLTTSTTAGHAMKANNPGKSFGAVLGKALGPLKEGSGLIPILVALQ